MNEKTRLKKGQAKIEFIACQDEAEKWLAAGYDIKATYQKLKEAGRITMSYKAFHNNLVKTKAPQKERKKAVEPPVELAPVPPKKSPVKSSLAASGTTRQQDFKASLEARLKAQDEYINQAASELPKDETARLTKELIG